MGEGLLAPARVRFLLGVGIWRARGREALLCVWGEWGIREGGNRGDISAWCAGLGAQDTSEKAAHQKYICPR